MSSAAPGWYTDPADSSRIRYWDGSTWSDSTQAATSPGSGPAAPGGRGGPGRIVLLVALGALLVAAGAGAFLLLSADDAGAEVILEPTQASGADPFTESVAQSEVEVEGGEVREISGGGGSIESVPGATPGLYGGTGRTATCDAEALTGFLEQNPDKAAAFAAVVGVAPDELEDYIGGLTPVVLREDTRVTNHGFAGGQATPRQAVLQAGTAVMVDRRGVPRVRCACGNPLAEPAAVSSSPEFQGERWESFDDDRIVAVSAAPEPVDSFELVNVRNGRTYTADAGQAVGDVRDLVFDFGGVGPLRVGMTEKEAERATGLEVRFQSFANPPCSDVSFPELGDEFGGLAFDGKRIAYLESFSGQPSTPAGIRRGESSRRDIERAYPDVTETDEPDLSGNPAVTWLVVDDGEGNGLLFMLENDVVMGIRTGTPESVLNPEGCL